MIHVESAEVTESGFFVSYSKSGYAGNVFFYPADADGSELSYPYAQYSLNSPAQRLLGQGGTWMSEYKGQPVSRVTDDQIAAVQSILVEHMDKDAVLVSEDAVEIVLK